MDDWLTIRRRVLVEGVSKRQVLRETGMHWRTLAKILTHSRPPGYRRGKEPAQPKIGPYLDRIRAILAADREVPRKQRHTAKRIWERLVAEEGFPGGYTIVKDAVRRLKAQSREVFMPLSHRPGEAQVDFGQAVVTLGGRLRKVAFFVMSLVHSDAMFVMAFPRECTEAFWEGHVRAFEFFGFVPRRITYDNTRVAISAILGARLRKLTDAFKQLISHYLFDPHFCRVRRANEKGVAEGAVKYSRLTFFVPVPQVRDFEALNAQLLAGCESDLARRLRGKTLTKRQLLQEDHQAGLALPATPFEACRMVSTVASSESLVRFDTNDYSVPVAYAHRPVVLKAGVQEVRISCGRTVIARHPRCWDRERQVFDPVHYLALLARKPGSLDHARPLEDWALPACFGLLRRRLEIEREDGTKEYIRVLLLLQTHSLRRLTQAVERAVGCRAHTRDAVAQFLIPAEPGSATTFRLDGREHLRYVSVQTTDVSAYRGLLAGGVA